jgi:hypothetical protein
VLFALQAGLMVFGFWLALRVLQQRSIDVLNGQVEWKAGYLLPGVLFIICITAFNLWLLAQPMVMRM